MNSRRYRLYILLEVWVSLCLLVLRRELYSWFHYLQEYKSPLFWLKILIELEQQLDILEYSILIYLFLGRMDGWLYITFKILPRICKYSRSIGSSRNKVRRLKCGVVICTSCVFWRRNWARLWNIAYLPITISKGNLKQAISFGWIEIKLLGSINPLTL
jgi:hypothetical protein